MLKRVLFKCRFLLGSSKGWSSLRPPTWPTRGPWPWIVIPETQSLDQGVASCELQLLLDLASIIDQYGLLGSDNF